jgi:LemA protein
MKKSWIILLGIIPIFMGIGNFNSLQSTDESVIAAWSEVINQYQRRADLIPNLVNTVKGYAQHEKNVFLHVTEARSKIGAMKISADQLNDPAALKQLQNAQGELSNALSKLLAISENYPQLKADINFRDLQSQLEGTENRIAVARNRYIQTVQNFNVKIRTFPTNIIAKLFHFSIKPNFTVENEAQISHPHQVDF